MKCSKTASTAPFSGAWRPQHKPCNSTREVLGGGVRAPVEKYFRNFALWRNTFCPKSRIFFEIFEMYLHTTPQKSLFIAFLLTNFPKISKKVLKKFSRRLRRRKCGEIPQFFW